MDTIEARFAGPEARRRVRDFVAGLLAPLPAKNCWTIAEHAGDTCGVPILGEAYGLAFHLPC